MAEENTTKRAFHEDIFADDNDKWSWPVGGSASKVPASGSNYDAYPTGPETSSSSEDGFVIRSDSNSLKKAFKKKNSSCESEENNSKTSSSDPLCRISGLSHERLLPSIYDDDARSGSPGGVVFDNKDLAFDSLKTKLISPKQILKESPKHDKEPPLLLDKDKKSKSTSPLPKERPRSDSRDERSRKSSSDQKSRDRKSHSREKKLRKRSRSRSRSREKRHSSRSRERRISRKPHQRGRRSRSREYRRRSRSRSYDRHRRRGRSSSRERYRRKHYSRSRSHSRERSRGSSSRKSGFSTLTSSGTVITPQMALQQTMAAMNAKAQALTGIALPRYYNPAAVNPLKYAEQVQKRKLLWQNKDAAVPENKEKEEPKSKNCVWDKLTFAQDQDGRMTAKFRKLMGIKSEGGPAEQQSSEPVEEGKESVLKKQEDLFRDLDQQYEMARVTTHTQRGVGLGYSHQPLYPAMPK